MQLRMVAVVIGGLRETVIEDLGRLARLDGMSFELRIGQSMQLFGAAKAAWASQEQKRLTKGVQGE